MRASGLVHLYFVRLRSRLVQELLAVVGIAVGVALIFAALVANTSLTGSMRDLTEGIVGEADLQLSARGPGGFDERLLKRVERISGVEAAAPVLEARANVVGPRGRRSVLLIGADPRFAQIGGPLVRPFAAVGEDATRILSGQKIVAVPSPIAAQAGIALGADVRIEAGARTAKVPLGVQLQRDDIGAMVDSPIAIAPLPHAQELSGMSGRVTRIFVKVRKGANAEVETALREIADGRLSVRAADADAEVFEQAAYPTKQSTTLFSMLSALVGFLFALSAVLLTVPHRRGLISDIQLAGLRNSAVVEALLLDAMVLGVVGSALGLVLGDQVSRHMFDDVPDYLSFTFSIGPQRTITWTSVAIAAIAGVVAACAAVLLPLRDALWRHPLMPKVRRTGRSVMRLIGAGGLSALAFATAIVVALPQLAVLGLAALTLSLVLLLPLLLRVVTWAFAAVTRSVVAAAPPLAALELRSNASQVRTIAIAATGALALFATVSIAGARADLQRGLDASTRDNVGNADIWITFPDAPNVLATTPFEDSALRRAAVERVTGVDEVRVYRGSLLDIGDHRAWVLAPPSDAEKPVPPTQVREGNAAMATERLREGGWVMLSEAIADLLHVGVSDRITLPSPVPRTFRVAAVSTNLGWSPGSILLNADDYVNAWDTTAASAFHVDLADGISVDRAKRRIERTLGSDVPLQVETKTERLARHYEASRNGLTRLTQISILVLIAAVLAMAAAMAGMIWQRRPILARLKVQGFSQRSLWQALLIESAILVGTGCVAGAAFGLYGQVLLSRALETITGFPVFYSAAVLAAAAILVLVMSVALAMLALPGWLAVRVRAAPSATT